MMAGFFSLGGVSSSSATRPENTNNNSPQHNTTENQNQSGSEIPHQQHSLFWPQYKNDPSPTNYTNKPSSFELWQTQDHHQQQQQFLYHHRHHHHHHLHPQDLYSAAAGPGGAFHRGMGVEDGRVVMRSSMSTSTTSGASGSGGGGGVSCQDCGNQAKKDCVHMRCRTCCKSRGFDCQTHIKSTWVPAAKRRDRQLQLQQHHQQHQNLITAHHDHDDDDDHDQDRHRGVLQISTKRHRDSSSTHRHHPSSHTTLAPRLPSSSPSGLEVGNFPAEVSSNAVFRCVRVSSVDSGDDQYAYQTAVSIGGHLFKGILLDHGPESTTNYSTSTIGAESSSGQPQPLDLITTTADAATAAAQFVDPSALYQSAQQPINAYAIAGTQFFLPPRS